jgi:predicted RNA binding protein YcfA (HicA-like mRNA interferase family)
MSRLPVISGRQCVRALEKVGFAEDHQTGGHIVLRRENPIDTISVPNHRELRKGTLRAIIKQAGLTVDEFVELL